MLKYRAFSVDPGARSLLLNLPHRNVSAGGGWSVLVPEIDICCLRLTVWRKRASLRVRKG
jgi:hypothetical protein